MNSEENSKRKVPNQMAKSKDKLHQTNVQQQNVGTKARTQREGYNFALTFPNRFKYEVYKRLQTWNGVDH